MAAKKGGTQDGKGAQSSSGGATVPYYAWAAVAAVIAVLLGAGAYFALRIPQLAPYLEPYFGQLSPLTPLRKPLVKNVAEFDLDYKNELLWGSYRSGLYFGMRTRTPKSLLIGLMWFDPDDYETARSMRVRHEASQGDGLARYGWLRHDGRRYGRQNLIDGEYNITVTMVKHFGPESGPGGDWAMRLQVQRTANATTRRRRISLLVYVGEEGTSSLPWQVLPEGESGDLRSAPLTLLEGGSASIGGGAFSMHLQETTEAVYGKRRSKPSRLDYLSLGMETKDYLLPGTLRDILLGTMWERLERQPSSDKFRLYLPNGVSTGSDLAFFQLSCSLPSAADYVFLSHRGPMPSGDSEALSARVAALSGAVLSGLVVERERAFEQRFQATFGTAAADTSAAMSPETSEVAKAALSNMLGSMGYFYGSSLVRVPGHAEPQPYPPSGAPLFTAVPSRSFFPRGFLWDEGFHQLLVGAWDPQVSRDVLAHWLDLMNHEGWIPREQILGAEARARVPAEFVVQNPSHANPPSLFLPIRHLADKLTQQGVPEAERAAVASFLSAAWPRLETWYGWFNTTQTGQVPTTYRWHGRNASAGASELNPKTLTSGLDDYPRASHPDETERHLDLRCWMALASRAMSDIGSALGLPQEVVVPYAATAAELSDPGLLVKLHYDSRRGYFSDWGMHTEAVELTRRTVIENGQAVEVSQRLVSSPPAPQLVPQYGYVSLFPLLMGLIPYDSELLPQQLALLRQEAAFNSATSSEGNGGGGGLWSKAGLRSLASTASLYMKRNTLHDPPYWRGQVWININYLALRALDAYGRGDGPAAAEARRLHDELRANVLDTVVGQYMTKGYLFEQYNDITGEGISSHPFTGWTALVTLIATRQYYKY